MNFLTHNSCGVTLLLEEFGKRGFVRRKSSWSTKEKDHLHSSSTPKTLNIIQKVEQTK